MFVRFDGWNDIGVRFPWFWRQDLGYFQSPVHKDNPSQRYYSVFVLYNGRTVTLTSILRSMSFIGIKDSSSEYWTRVCSVPVKVKSYVTNLMQFLKTCVTDMSKIHLIFRGNNKPGINPCANYNVEWWRKTNNPNTAFQTPHVLTWWWRHRGSREGYRDRSNKGQEGNHSITF